MSKQENRQNKPQNPNNVIAFPVKCAVDGCKSKPRRLHFCQEHFAWFKEGLITREGAKAKDFDKKHQDMQKRAALKKAG